MSRFIYYFFLLILCASCAAQKIVNPCSLSQEKTEKLLLPLLKELKTKGFLVKVDPNLKPSVENISMEDLFSDNYFSMIQNFGAKTEDELVRFDEVFNEKDYNFFLKQLDCGKDAKMVPLINELNNLSGGIGEFENLSIYSIPFYSKDGKYAIIYVETQYSGEIKVYRMMEGKWYYFAQGTVWIS